MSAAAYPNYSPGLEGVIGGITTISEINSDLARLVYRGIDVQDLAEHGSFEETAHLLLLGKLPNAAELASFKQTLAQEREVPKEVYDCLKLHPKQTHPMEALRTAFSLLATFDPDHSRPATDHDANVRKAIRILAKAGTIVGNSHRIRQGLEPLAPKPELSIAGSFLHLMNGEEADAATTKVLDASLTLYAEHGYNASTFACRVTVATLSDLYSGVVSGIGTLKGPLHGGANEEAMYMLKEIGTPENAEPWLRDALATKKKIMGFGHREYKKGDSRAKYMSRQAAILGEKTGETKWGQIAAVMEKIMADEKGIYPNVDFPAAYAYYLLGIPIDLYTPIFVIARVSGWCSHAIEQLDNNRLIRPGCIYEGPNAVPFTPIEQR